MAKASGSLSVIGRELLRKIRRLEITTRKAVHEQLAGQYHSRFKGHGIAFSEVRPYQPGDEVRRIDWNVSARSGELFVKVFHEERELTVMLLVDVSASGDFGSGARSKTEAAAQLAAQVAFSAVANGDRVGLILFSDTVEKLVPPRKGRKHALAIIADILTHEPAGHGTNLDVALTALLLAQRRRAVVFLISDFQARGYEQRLTVVAKKHDLVPVAISDPVENELPDTGLFALVDPETGEEAVVDTSDPEVRRRYWRAIRDEAESRRTLFRRLRLDSLELSVDDDHGDALARLFRRRSRGRA
jgi:uncharacterized protein (DUF58 family)